MKLCLFEIVLFSALNAANTYLIHCLVIALALRFLQKFMPFSAKQ